MIPKGEQTMIKVIAGPKGTGKTAKLVDDINEVARTDSNVHTDTGSNSDIYTGSNSDIYTGSNSDICSNSNRRS